MPPAADEVCEVIITAPDPDWLVEFTRRLVIDRPCASGHNFAPIRTIYRWQGQVHDTTEGRVARHPGRALLPQIVDRAKREHPYEVPSPAISCMADFIDSVACPWRSFGMPRHPPVLGSTRTGRPPGQTVLGGDAP